MWLKPTVVAANVGLTLLGYGGRVNEPPTTDPNRTDADPRLREELAHAEAALGMAAPILRHLLVNDDRSLFSDEIVARVRGMIGHLAAQLLFARAEAAAITDSALYIADHQDALAAALCANDALLLHAHARALEGQLAEQLQQRSGIDPVLTPLVQDLVASEDTETASRAMALLAAQTRFVQHHRRMELPLHELPGELFHCALLALRSHAGGSSADPTEQRLRAAYDEGAGRLALLTRLAMTAEGAAAYVVDHDGLALFATALALATDQPREMIVLSFAESQLPRLVMSLRAAGLSPPAVQRQVLYFQPVGALQPLADVSPAAASA